MDTQLFQFDIYDEYVYNAIAFTPSLIDYRIPAGTTNNASSVSGHNSYVSFQSLNGNATTDDEHNVMMYFTLWDLDPRDGLFYPVLQQADPPRGTLVVVRNRVIHWPGNGDAPTPDYCAFVDCSTGIVSAVDRSCIVPVS